MARDGYLNVSPTLSLPAEAVTGTFAILGKRGGGKSNAAVVMAEEMSDVGYQWVAIDPKGDWWGIRSSADGKGEGISAPVFGGRHGDLPLEATAGALIANLIVERNLTAVIDVSLFSTAEQRRFVTDFAHALFRAAADDPAPRHLFLEEAEEFLPQQVTNGTRPMVNAYSKIAKQGRTSGLGVTLVTQRSASLNKDALSQTDTLIAFRSPSPHDQAPINAWAKYHVEAPDLAATLAELAAGESWVLSPGFLGSIQRITWNRRRTFDSGATPVVGKRLTPPARLAEVDLAAIKELMAETVERAKADDPKLLRKEITGLRAELTKVSRDYDELLAKPAPEPTVQFLVPADIIDTIVETDEIMGRLVDAFAIGVNGLQSQLEEIVTTYDERRILLGDQLAKVPAGPIEGATPARQTARPATPERPQVSFPADPPARQTAQPEGEVKLDKAMRAFLSVLATYRDGISTRRMAHLAGYTPGKSTVRSALGALRTAGYVAPGDPVFATPAGLAALGPVEPLPSGTELVAHWLAKLDKAQGTMFTAFINAWPEPLDRETLAEVTGYDASKSTFRSALGRLRALEVVDDWKASDDLMAAIHA